MENKREIRDDDGGLLRVLDVRDGGVTEEQIKAWKGEYRKVHVIEVEDDGELFVGYFRRPNMETMAAVNKLAKTDEVKSSATLFDNCWLGGDPLVKSDTIVRVAAIGQLAEMFNRVIGTLKNA
jgi:hypothetical protein